MIRLRDIIDTVKLNNIKKKAKKKIFGRNDIRTFHPEFL